MSAMVTHKFGADKSSVFQEPLTVFLDTGTQISYLPLHIIQPLIDLTAATKVTSSLYKVDCESEGLDLTFSGSVDFGFGNVTINVPMQHLVFYSGGDDCYLTIGETNDPLVIPYVLGETFLRSAFGEYCSRPVLSSLLNLSSRLRPRQPEHPSSSRRELWHQSRAYWQGARCCSFLVWRLHHGSERCCRRYSRRSQQRCIDGHRCTEAHRCAEAYTEDKGYFKGCSSRKDITDNWAD
jgi:Eukaryotic aspartyl protease